MLTGTRVMAVVLSAAFALSCSDASSTPAAPTPAAVTRHLLSGTVTDDAGRPLAGVAVFGIGSKFNFFSATTDASGQYRGPIGPGHRDLTFTLNGFRQGLRSVAIAADTIVDISLRPGVIVSGNVSELGGADHLRGVTVEILTGPDAGKRATSGQPGASDYSFVYLTPGQFRMRASKNGFETVELDVNATVNTTVNFTLRQSGA